MTQGREDGDRGKLGLGPSESGDAKAKTSKSGLDAANDLTALLSRAALSESQYREFSPAPRASQQSQAVSNTPEDHSKTAVERAPTVPSRLEPRGVVHLRLTDLEEHSDRGVAADISDIRIPTEEVVETSRSIANHLRGDGAHGDGNGVKAEPPVGGNLNGWKKVDSTLESRWSVLGRALSGESDNSPGQLIQALSSSVLLPFAFIAPIRGGTGVTTILATLARCFAARGERVLLADNNAASLLPLYFGAANSGTGELQSFSTPNSNGRVDTINRSEPKKQAGPLSPRATKEPEQISLVSTVRSAAVRSHRLLLDPGVLHPSDAETLRPAKQLGLVPLVPDLSCVFGLLRIEEALRPREPKTRSSCAVFYVLNKFDSSLALHRDVKASLEKLLGDRLLPFTLRRSDAVAEALAEGTTVIDYCPEAGIAQDFVRLADWLLEWDPTSFRERGE